MSDERKQIMLGIRNSAVIKNPVLFEAVGIAPVVAMAVSLKSAIMLSAVSFVELIFIELFACLLLKKIKREIRVLIYAVLGVLINVPFYMFFNHFAPNETSYVGIFLPLIAVNSLVALHCERIAVRNNMKNTAIDAFSASIGYVLIILIMGTVRELLGSGTIYGVDLHLPIQFSGLVMPFGGFLILGFMAAFCKWVISRHYPEEKPEAAFNLSEVSQSHIANIKVLLEDDFNPYDDIQSDSAEPVKEKKPRVKKEKPAKPQRQKPVKTKQKQEKPKKEKKAEKPFVPYKEDNISPVSPEVKPETKEAGKRREYVSEFDDILSALDNKKQDETTSTSENEKGGDEK